MLEIGFASQTFYSCLSLSELKSHDVENEERSITINYSTLFIIHPLLVNSKNVLFGRRSSSAQFIHIHIFF
jgi:hypothetical protein